MRSFIPIVERSRVFVAWGPTWKLVSSHPVLPYSFCSGRPGPSPQESVDTRMISGSAAFPRAEAEGIALQGVPAPATFTRLGEYSCELGDP